MAGRTAQLRTTLRWCGGLQLTVFGLLVPISYGIGPVTPFRSHVAQEIATLRGWADTLGIPGLRRYVSGHSVFSDLSVAAIVYGAAFAIASATFLTMLFALRRAGDEVDDETVERLYGFGKGFALANLLAYPMLTSDFWWFIAWGRMVLAGHNPAYEFLTNESVAGLPFEAFDILMGHGALWALICGALAALAVQRVFLEFLFFKIAIAAFWLWCLWLVKEISRGAPNRERALALCCFGWMPLSSHVAIAEGHNDVAMAAFVLLWLYLATKRNSPAAPLALLASVLAKYASLLLVPLELLHAWRSGRAHSLRYVAGLAVGIALAGLVLVAFARDFDFFVPAASHSGWSFLTPSRALFVASTTVGIPIGEWMWLLLVRIVISALALFEAQRFWRDPSPRHLLGLSVAIFAAVLLAGVGHIWPWYLLWCLGVCALRTDTLLAQFMLAIALCAPFLGLHWILAERMGFSLLVTLGFYLCAVPLTVAVRFLVSPTPPAPHP